MIVLLLVALAGCVVDGAVDLTVTENAAGSAVVNAVVDNVTQSCVFANDRLMLRRIAYAETKDGTADYVNFARGGIWQVDEASFTAIRSNLSASRSDIDQAPLRTNIKAKFNIDWTRVQYVDLQKPLYSGLAAMLKIATHYGFRDLPQSVSDQARYWVSSYTVNSWTNAVDVYSRASTAVDAMCRSPKADVVFVVDGSGSIGSSNFRKVKSFIQQVVDSFDIGNETVRVGFIQFSDSANIQFDLRRYSSKDVVRAAVQGTPYQDRGTNSAAGLQTATNMITQQGRQNDGVPMVVIFLTDGQSNSLTETRRAANNLHATIPEATVFVVGVGSNVNMEELNATASQPKCNHVYLLSGFSDITSFASQIMKGACKAQAMIKESREVSATLDKDQPYYFTVKAKKEKNGVRLRVSVTSGCVRAYYSWTVKNPSEASYDAMREVDAQEGSVFVDIPWNNEAEARAQEVPLTSGGGNDTTLESPLYGAMVGVESGQNQFWLKYTDSAVPEQNVDTAVQNTVHLLLLLTACVLSSMLLNTA